VLKTAKRGWRLAAAAGLMFLWGALWLSACDSQDGAGTAPPRETAMPTALADTPTPRAETPTAEAETPAVGEPAGVLADAGREVFARECAECHGARGEGLVGPVLIGEDTNLPAFGTAEGLYEFISQGMPLDAPGSLPEQEYLEVLAFLLLENARVEEDTPLGMEGLSDIDLQ